MPRGGFPKIMNDCLSAILHKVGDAQTDAERFVYNRQFLAAQASDPFFQPLLVDRSELFQKYDRVFAESSLCGL